MVNVIYEVSEICDTYELQGHVTCDCSILPAFKQVLSEQAYTFNMILQLANNQYFSTYSPAWKNHPNLQWKQHPQ